MYNEKFFKKNKEGSLSSAREIVPLILKLVHAKSVVDLGCGTGTWLSVFRSHKVKDLLGIDGDYVNPDMLLIPKKNFLTRDLSKPINLKRTFDLAICLEVAEHLPKESSFTLVKSITNLSPVVIFSSAIPFQGGRGHVNEQWPDFWIKLFSKRGYIVIDCLRRETWNNKKVEFWYSQNMLFFVRKSSLKKYPLLKKQLKSTYISQISIVHPELYKYWWNFAKLKAAVKRRLG